MDSFRVRGGLCVRTGVDVGLRRSLSGSESVHKCLGVIHNLSRDPYTRRRDNLHGSVNLRGGQDFCLSDLLCLRLIVCDSGWYCLGVSLARV